MISTRNVLEKLTKEAILRRISELDMFFYYIPSFQTLGRKFMSELRDDGQFPSASVIMYNGRPMYKEFGKGECSQDIFGYVQLKFGVNFYDALKIIANDFNLMGTGKIPTRNFFGQVSEVEIIEQKVKKNIRVKFRKWDNRDKLYWWDRYKISSLLLTEHQVYPLEGYYYGSYWYPSKELTYGYYSHPDKWKIYRPLNEEGRKWPVGNFTKDIFCGYDQLPWLGEKLIITSSRKDMICWRLLNYHSINPQGELNNFDVLFIENLKHRFPNLYLNYDNDEAGIKNANSLLKLFPFLILIYIPEHKDLSDYIWKEGLEKAEVMVKDLMR